MATDLLTPEKQKWAKQFKPDVLRGTTLAYNAGIQARYGTALTALILQMSRQCQREITKLFKTDTAKEYYSGDVAMDASISSQARILTNQLTAKFDQLFSDKAPFIADQMVQQTNKASSASVSASMKQLSGGLTIKTTTITGEMEEIIKASVTENVGLIKSISQKYLTEMQGAVMRSITTGNGLQDLVPFFKNYEGVTIRRARLIAQDQTKKAYSNLSAARMESIGVDKYEWIHSGGGAEPRDLHERLSGNIYSLKDPPIIQYAKGTQPEIRGKPGDLINCRCTMRPIIDFEAMADG